MLAAGTCLMRGRYDQYLDNADDGFRASFYDGTDTAVIARRSGTCVLRVAAGHAVDQRLGRGRVVAPLLGQPRKRVEFGTRGSGRFDGNGTANRAERTTDGAQTE